jgi:hypothetical protein
LRRSGTYAISVDKFNGDRDEENAMLLITDPEVRQVLNMCDCIEAMEPAFADLNEWMDKGFMPSPALLQ